eukprot:gene8360-biopygen9156
MRRDGCAGTNLLRACGIHVLFRCFSADNHRICTPGRVGRADLNISIREHFVPAPSRLVPASFRSKMCPKMDLPSFSLMVSYSETGCIWMRGTIPTLPVHLSLAGTCPHISDPAFLAISITRPGCVHPVHDTCRRGSPLCWRCVVRYPRPCVPTPVQCKGEPGRDVDSAGAAFAPALLMGGVGCGEAREMYLGQ